MVARRRTGSDPQRGLGRAVQFLREQTKLTPTELAAGSGVPAPWISQIEAGEVDPTWATTRSIAATLEVSMETLAETAERFEEKVIPDGKASGSHRIGAPWRKEPPLGHDR